MGIMGDGYGMGGFMGMVDINYIVNIILYAA